jgi:hypothetical protein
VRGDVESQLSSLENHESVTAVESRPPNLEDIFVAYMNRHGTSEAHVPDDHILPREAAAQ